MATPKQTALLQFLGIDAPDSKSEASTLIEHLVDHPDYAESLEAWKFERLWLHPNLYASELKDFKSGRAAALRDANNNERGPGCPLRKLSIEQVQTVVDWLDLNHPNWDRYFRGLYGFLNLEMFHDGFIPLAAQLLPNVVKRGYEHVLKQTPAFKFPSQSSASPATAQGNLDARARLSVMQPPRPPHPISTARSGRAIKRLSFINPGSAIGLGGITCIVGSLFVPRLFFQLVIIAGIALIVIGWAIERMCVRWLCSECGNRVEKQSTLCPTCRALLLHQPSSWPYWTLLALSAIGGAIALHRYLAAH